MDVLPVCQYLLIGRITNEPNLEATEHLVQPSIQTRRMNEPNPTQLS